MWLYIIIYLYITIQFVVVKAVKRFSFVRIITLAFIDIYNNTLLINLDYRKSCNDMSQNILKRKVQRHYLENHLKHLRPNNFLDADD